MIDEAKEVDGNKKQQRYVTHEERLLMSVDNETVTEERKKQRKKKSVYQVTTYRLPYMTMPKKTLNRIFWSLFGFIMALSLLQV